MIVDREEYEKDKVFHIVLGEPEVIHCQEAKISNIDSIEDEGLRKILEAGKPALGKSCCTLRSFGRKSAENLSPRKFSH